MSIKNKHFRWLSVLTVVLAMLVACGGWIDLSELDEATPSDEATPLDHSGHVLGAAPRGDGLRRIDRIGHSVGYDEDRGNPAWVAYHLIGMPAYDGGDRPGFHIDDDTEARISKGDYTNSGYSRGHLAPNHAIATYYGSDAQYEAFEMSNIIPQKQTLNGGAWRALEENINGEGRYADTLGEVWVMAGPVYAESMGTLSDEGKVAIPSHCYMIIVDEDGGSYRAMAFIFPQEPDDDYALSDFLTTIDDIESQTGLDFFSGMPGEAAIERSQAPSVW